VTFNFDGLVNDNAVEGFTLVGMAILAKWRDES